MASIKLRGDTSGELVIEAPAVAGTNTLTLPADTANILTNNSSLPAANLTGSLPSGMGGKILQVQYTQLTSAFSKAVTANVSTDITNFNVDITPTSASSKVLLQVSWFGEYSQIDDTYDSMWFLYRDATKLSHPTTGSRNVGIAGAAINYTSPNAASTAEVMNMQYIDTPNTTSTITYKVGIQTYRTGTIYVNRTVADSNSGNHERGISSIIAIEIGA
jgi:hypothetical protein